MILFKFFFFEEEKNTWKKYYIDLFVFTIRLQSDVANDVIKKPRFTNITQDTHMVMNEYIRKIFDRTKLVRREW